MANIDREIDQLSKEIRQLREAFSLRIFNLEQRLEKLKKSTLAANPSSAPSDATLAEQPATVVTHTRITHADNSALTQPAHQEYAASVDDRPGRSAPAQSLVSVLGNNLGALLTPFSKLFSPLRNWYQHYEAKGQGPIFVFMLIGIVLLVCGFAYLAQLLIGELAAGSKSLLLFTVSIGVTLGGHKLAKKTRFDELGSATISLGLLLNFVTIYIAGSFYHLLPDWLVLVAYIVVGLSGFVLASLHSAKIVSALSVIGGASVPLLTLVDSSGTSLYLCGLIVLAMGSFYQAAIKNWLWLNWTTLAVCTASLEYLSVLTSSSWLLLIFCQLFYCMYFAVIWQMLRCVVEIKKAQLLFVSLAVFSTIGLLFQVAQNPAISVTIIALTNGLLCLFARARVSQPSPHVKSLYAMLASVWLLVAIFSSLQSDYWGFAVGLEALVLLYFGLKLTDRKMRLEAYALLLFAALHGLFAIAPYFPAPALLTLKGQWVLISIGALLLASRKLLQYQAVALKQRCFHWEKTLEFNLRAAESLWLVTWVIATAWVYLGHWFYLALIPLQGLLFYKSHRKACQMSEGVVLLIVAVYALTALFAALQAQSLSFRDLPVYAQSVLPLLLLELWLLCEFYRRTQRTGKMAEVAESLRLLAYMVSPLILIPSVAKHYPEYLSMAFWLSCTMAYVLARLVKHAMLRTEALLVCLLSAIYALLSPFDYPPLLAPVNSVSLTLGLIFLGFILTRASQRHLPQLERKIASIGLYYYLAVLFIVTMVLSNVFLAAAASCLWVVVLLLKQDLHPTIKRNQHTLQSLFYLNCALAGFCGLLISSAHLVSISVWLGCNVLLLISELIRDKKHSAPVQTLIQNPQKRYLVHHVMVSIGLSVLLVNWRLELLIAPCLILQGSYLFFAQKRHALISKSALIYIFCGLLKLGLIDAASAQLWQKVALLISIGIFMVLAAFAYQRRIADKP